MLVIEQLSRKILRFRPQIIDALFAIDILIMKTFIYLHYILHLFLDSLLFVHLDSIGLVMSITRLLNPFQRILTEKCHLSSVG